MFDKELSYFKDSGLGDNTGLGKVRLGRIFLTACPQCLHLILQTIQMYARSYVESVCS